MIKFSKKRGLTLVELVTVLGLVSIIGIGIVAIMNPIFSSSNQSKTMSDYQQTSRHIKNILLEKLQFSNYLGIVDEDSVGMPSGCRYIYTRGGYLYESIGDTEELLLSQNYYDQILYDIVFSKSTRESDVLYVKLRAYKKDGTEFENDLFSIKILNLLGSYRSIDVISSDKEHNFIAYKAN